MTQVFMDGLMRRIVEILEYEFRIKIHDGYLGDYRPKDRQNNEFFFNAGQVSTIEFWKPGQSYDEPLRLNISDYWGNPELGQYILDWMRQQMRIWIDEVLELKERENFNQQCRDRAKVTTVQFSYESFQTSDGNLEGMKEAASLEEAVKQIIEFPMGFVEVQAIFPLFDNYARKIRKYPLLLFIERGVEKMKQEINSITTLDINDFLFRTKYPTIDN